VLGPIFMRELVTVPRRRGHFPTRAALIGLIAILGVTLWQASVGFARTATLGEAARFGLRLFQVSVYVELVLLVFFAALSAASTVSQEKDRRTFLLLLLTDMRDYEIVLGKLLGSLLPLTVMLLTSVPVLALFLLLGGIDPTQVIQAVVVLAAAAYAAGSVGGLVALWRERTFQSLALSVLLLVLYFCLGQAVGVVGPLVSQNVDWVRVQTWLDPVYAMEAVLEPPAAGWGAGLPPAYGFALVMLGWCVVLNGVGIRMLRRWNPSGEPVMQREGPGDDPEADMSPEELKAFRAKAHAAPGPVRQVWANPILWREVSTYAYGRRPLLVKLAYGVVLALVLWFAYGEMTQPGGRAAFAAAYGLVPLTVLGMLLVAAQAATSITSERDGGALDVLLVTDVSPREFVFGKLLGVFYNTWQFVVPPLLLAVAYAVAGALARTPADAGPVAALGLNFGPMFGVMGAVAVLVGFSAALGLHVALREVSSRLAIVNTLGTVFFLSVGTLISIYLIVINGGSFANQWLSFVAFLVLGIGGLMWVLNGDRPSRALSLGAAFCPLAMFYCVVNILIAKPGTEESAAPLVPFLTLAGAFVYTVVAMLYPLVTEFDVALGRTTQPNEE
jgi:ABC-type Na+ efflux pump permease subunit